MTDRELMQQALEALENVAAHYGDYWEDIIAALRERLAQPQSCLKSAVCERGADGYCARCHERMYP